MKDYIKAHRTSIILSLLCTAFYAAFAYDLNRSDFIKLISLSAALFFLTYKLLHVTRGSLWFLLVIGIVFRLISLVAIPNLSQDFYRFLWDGRLLLQGINPYAQTPQGYLEQGDLVVAQARELVQGMGALNASHYSNYPPVHQLFFGLSAFFAPQSIWGAVVGLKILMLLADLGILYFGRKLLLRLRLDPHLIFWYFLNPFIIIEMGGNLHFESVMLFFLVWSLYLLYHNKWVWAAVVFGISVSVKLLPLLLLPLFYQWFISTEKIKKSLLKLLMFYSLVIGTVALTFVPFLSSEIISNFLKTIALWFQNFEFNASVYYVIRWIGYKTVGWNIIETTGKILPVIVVFFLVVLAFFRRNTTFQQLITAFLLGVSFYFLLATTVHPWYVATPLLLSLFTRYRFPIVWSGMVFLSYAAYGATGFSENLFLVAIEYIVVASVAIWEIKKASVQQKPHKI